MHFISNIKFLIKMPHISVVERLRIIKIFKMSKHSRHSNKAKLVQTIAFEVYSIKVSLKSVYNIINKWVNLGILRD